MDDNSAYPEKYDVFGGLLKAYMALLFVYAVASVYWTIAIFIRALGWFTTFDNITIVLLCMYAAVVPLKLWICISTARRIRVRNQKTPPKIVRSITIYALIYSVLCVLRLAFIFMLTSRMLDFLSMELSAIFESIIFISVGILYFKWSRRVECYYRVESHKN